MQGGTEAIPGQEREARRARVVPALRRFLSTLGVVVLLWGAWEAYRSLWLETGWTRPFQVYESTMPHIHDMFAALFEPTREGGPLLLAVLWDAALFTAREAALGFAMGTAAGFALGVILAHSRILQRGLLPYVVASQTVPILAIAPMVVVWLSSLQVTAWISVSVIAAYLTFFPVAINTLRGLHSVDRRALELMRSYAASTWSILWKLRVPASLPFVFSALRVSATACVVGAIIGELPSSVAGGLGGAILNFAQYYSFQPQNLWATNIVAAMLGIAFFLVVVGAERLLVRRPPERIG